LKVREYVTGKPNCIWGERRGPGRLLEEVIVKLGSEGHWSFLGKDRTGSGRRGLSQTDVKGQKQETIYQGLQRNPVGLELREKETLREAEAEGEALATLGNALRTA
jgi:hypothetical protein